MLEVGPDDDAVPWDLDHAAFVATAADGLEVDGVFSSSDLPGAALAAALAQRLGTPGTEPARVLGASNKLHVRTLLADLLPHATVRHRAVGPDDDDVSWSWPGPAFAKPIRGSFSRHATLVHDADQLRRHLQRPEAREFLRYWLQPYHAMRALWAPHLPCADRFLVEEPLRGTLVTVEGFVAGGRAQVLGIVDSTVDPATRSFLRFDYPSALPGTVQARMADAACRLATALGLSHTLFNVELFHDPATDRIGIVEINPRMCGQFADLYEKVDGTNAYDVALRVAVGEVPELPRRRGAFAAAASVPLRVFSPCRVVSAPDPQRVAAVEREHPGAIAMAEARLGEALIDFAAEDGASLRYAVVNVGGRDRDDVTATATRVERALGYSFVRA